MAAIRLRLYVRNEADSPHSSANYVTESETDTAQDRNLTNGQFVHRSDARDPNDCIALCANCYWPKTAHHAAAPTAPADLAK